jgi:hypothetical protein
MIVAIGHLQKIMTPYQEIRQQVGNLTLDEQLRLLEELASLVRPV